jgi:hypothetical protein
VINQLAFSPLNINKNKNNKLFLFWIILSNDHVYFIADSVSIISNDEDDDILRMDRGRGVARQFSCYHIHFFTTGACCYWIEFDGLGLTRRKLMLFS